METIEPKQKYLTKVIHFNGHKMTLYSLDGQTWSSKKFELSEIQERREQQRLALSGKKEEGDGDAVFSPKAAKLDDDSDYDDVDREPQIDPDEADEGFIMSDDSDDEPVAPRIAAKKLKIKPEIKKPKKLKVLKVKVAKKINLPSKPKTIELKNKKTVAKPVAKKAVKVKAKVSKVAKKVIKKKTAKNSATKRKAA